MAQMPAGFVPDTAATVKPAGFVPDGFVPDAPDFRASNEMDAQGRAVVEPNSVGTFARHVGAQVNPVGLGQMIPFSKAAGGAGWDAPLQALKNIGAAHEQVALKAKDAYSKGDYMTAGRHAVDYLIPVVGPILDKSADAMQRGDYAAGLGDAIGLALAMFGPAALAGRGGAAPVKAKPSAVGADQAAVQFGQAHGVPIDAATATGNRFVRSAQGLVDHSPIGSVVAERARTAQSTALTRVGGELADQAHPVAVTPEMAGESIRSGVKATVKARGEDANMAYGLLRDIEADPQFAQVVQTAPMGSATFQKILNKLKAGKEDGKAPTIPELTVMRQIETELDAIPYRKGKLLSDDPGVSSGTTYNPGSAGAPVYHEILQAAPGVSEMSRAEVLGAIQKTLATGEWTHASRGAYEVAKKRLRGSGSLTGPSLPKDAALLGSAERVSLPVELAGVKTALEPIYQRLMADNNVVPLQGGKGTALQALSRIMNGPDVVPVSVADAALGDLKTMARAAVPELRTQGQGVASRAVQSLDAAVQAAVNRAKGSGAVEALAEGRKATVAKYQAREVLQRFGKNEQREPVAVYKQVTAPQDAGIKLLRQVKAQAPEQIAEIGRAKLEEMMSRATERSGRFDHADRNYAEWQKLGTETKRILYPSPGHAQALDHFWLLAKKVAESPNPSQSGLVVNTGAQVALMFTHPALGIPVFFGTGALSQLLHSKAGAMAVAKLVGQQVKAGASSTGGVTKAAQAAGMLEVVRAAQKAGIPLTTSALPKAAGTEPTGSKP